jgi:hypothetical protein
MHCEWKIFYEKNLKRGNERRLESSATNYSFPVFGHPGADPTISGYNATNSTARFWTDCFFFPHVRSSLPQRWSQSYDRVLQRHWQSRKCVIKNSFFTSKYRFSLQQRWRCFCKFKSRSIGYWSQSYDLELQHQHCKNLQRNYLHNSMARFFTKLFFTDLKTL